MSSAKWRPFCLGLNVLIKRSCDILFVVCLFKRIKAKVTSPIVGHRNKLNYDSRNDSAFLYPWMECMIYQGIARDIYLQIKDAVNGTLRNDIRF